MLKKLQEIAYIVSGIYEKENPTGDTLYLQAKHFDEHGAFRRDIFAGPEIAMEEKHEKHLLQDGDLLLISKGDHNKACLYKSEIGRAVASSTFFVVRVVDPEVLPEYLQWFLNTAFMQARLSGLARGTHIRSISKKMLTDVMVQLPPVETQRRILEVQSLWDKERALTRELLEEKENLYQRLLINLTNSNSEK